MRELLIGRNDAGQRLDKFLTKSLYRLPVSLMQKYLRTKKIKVNRARAQGNTMLKEGDTIQLFIRDEFFEREEVSDSIYTTVPKLSVVYEDDNIIVCDKRPGVLVHPDDSGEERNTLLLHIKAYLCRNGEYSPEEENSFAPALCNRIDRNTGGMVIAAKNAEALREMNRIIKENLISKFYLCAVHGSVKKKADTLEGFLVKNSKDNLVTVSPTPFKGAKKIITKYKKLSEKHDLSLLEIELVTGRTHQIRAHMSYIGHPLLGDGKYGINKSDRSKGYKYQALYSYRLRFCDVDGPLSYLSHKEISVPYENIWFLKEFDVEKHGL